jgi:hypothetical protein
MIGAMNRIAKQAHAEMFADALRYVPGPIRRRLEPTHILTTADPVFVGLYDPVRDDWCREHASASYPYLQMHLPAAHRAPTIVVPPVAHRWFFNPDGAHIVHVLHEYGHILQSMVGWYWPEGEVSDYSTADAWECFAEAFVAWCVPDLVYTWFPHHFTARPDDRTRQFFDALAHDEWRLP